MVNRREIFYKTSWSYCGQHAFNMFFICVLLKMCTLISFFLSRLRELQLAVVGRSGSGCGFNSDRVGGMPWGADFDFSRRKLW